MGRSLGSVGRTFIKSFRFSFVGERSTGQLLIHTWGIHLFYHNTIHCNLIHKKERKKGGKERYTLYTYPTRKKERKKKSFPNSSDQKINRIFRISVNNSRELVKY